jgi:hypothetical protein
MPDQKVKPIGELIIEDLFSRLQKSESFSEDIIGKLKSAAEKGKLSSAKIVSEAIIPPED